MNQAIKVVVTAQDIALGKRRQAGCCPIALALKRRRFRGIVVGFSEVRIGRYWFRLPAEAEVWIADFDEGDGRPHPFSFTLSDARKADSR